MDTVETNIVAMARRVASIAQDVDEHLAKIKETARTPEGLAELEREYPTIRAALSMYDKALGDFEKTIAARRKLLRVELRQFKTAKTKAAP